MYPNCFGVMRQFPVYGFLHALYFTISFTLFSAFLWYAAWWIFKSPGKTLEIVDENVWILFKLRTNTSELSKNQWHFQKSWTKMHDFFLNCGQKSVAFSKFVDKNSWIFKIHDIVKNHGQNTWNCGQKCEYFQNCGRNRMNFQKSLTFSKIVDENVWFFSSKLWTKTSEFSKNPWHFQISWTKMCHFFLNCGQKSVIFLKNRGQKCVTFFKIVDKKVWIFKNGEHVLKLWTKTCECQKSVPFHNCGQNAWMFKKSVTF